MTLGTPLALAGILAAAVPIVLLYLLKVRRRQATVAYLRLWETLLVETPASALFHRLKRWASLLLQLAILLALGLALADPAFELDGEREHFVVLLDCSASMQTRELDQRSRFDHMLEAARAQVEARSPEDSMMIVAVSDRVDVLCPFTRNTLRLRGALDAARVTHRSLDAARSVAFARQVTQHVSSPKILFVSDGAAGAVERLEDVQLVAVGAEVENVGIVRFAVRKNTSVGTDYVLAIVKNFGLRTRSIRLELSLNGATQRVLPWTLAGGEEATVPFELTLPEGGTLRLRLDTGAPEAFSVDDSAYAIVRPARARRVLLITERPEQIPPFQIAFGSMKQVIDPTSSAVTLAEYADLDAEDRQADVVVCLGALPASLPPTSNLILIGTDLPASVPAERAAEAEDKPVVWDWDREHLLNRYLNWKDLPLPPARALTLRGGEPLVETMDGALIAAFESDARRVVVVAFDVTSSLFPFRLAFPMLLRNAIAWFDVEEDQLFADTYSPGAVIVPLRRVPGETVSVVYFKAGERTEASIDLEDGRFHFADTGEPGPFVFRAGAVEHATAVNLFDPAESAIAPAVPAAPEQPADVPRQDAGLMAGDLWRWLVLLGLFLWTVEWATYHRRVTE